MPDQILRIIIDATFLPADRVQAVRDLSKWICRGGFFPSGDPMDALGSLSWNESTDDELRAASTELAALKVALFYGDFSGLQGLGMEVSR